MGEKDEEACGPSEGLGWRAPRGGEVGGGGAAPRILGKATFVDGAGTAAPAGAAGVTVNFINLEGSLEESVASVQTDAQGKYRSAELPPGKYTVEAAYPGYVIERETVV